MRLALLKIRLSNKHALLTISLLYAVLSVLMFQRFGVKYVNDSHRYLEYAEGIRSGFYIDPHNIWYFSYVVFVFLVGLVSEAHSTLIFCQFFVGYLSMLLFYRAVVELTSVRIAFIATVMMLLFADTIFWSSYILAESFYLSSLLCAFYFFVKWHKGQKTVRNSLLLVLFCLIAFFAKPTAVALLAAFMGMAIYLVWKKVSSSNVKIGLTVGALILFLLVTNNMLGTFDLIENYRTGEIVYAMSTFPNHPKHDQLVLTVPNDLHIPARNLPPLIRLASFIAKNPMYSAELFFNKLAYSLLHVRPYWSFWHNAYMLILLLPVYYLAIRGFILGQLSGAAQVFVIVYFICHVMIFGCTTVDWDGRFFLPLIPVLTVLATVGISSFMKIEEQPINPI